MGFQKKFDVGSVFNAMTVAVFDSGMQQIVPMPKGNGFDMVVARGAIRGAENLVESYTADVITGAPRDLEDLLANALGTSASSVMSKYMPVIHRSKPGQSSQQSQRQLRPKVTHASNMKDDKMNGLDPDYHQSMLNGLGGVNSNIATPHPGDTWQTRQANGMNALDSNSNRPVTSNNQQRQSYGKSESYHYAVQAANDVLHLMHVAENAGAYLLYEAAANQVEATPTHAATAAQGGSPNARVNPSKGPALFSHTPASSSAHAKTSAVSTLRGSGNSASTSSQKYVFETPKFGKDGQIIGWGPAAAPPKESGFDQFLDRHDLNNAWYETKFTAHQLLDFAENSSEEG